MKNIYKILINGEDVNINSLIKNDGKYHTETPHNIVNVQIFLQDNTRIFKNMFNNCKGLKKVNIPSSVKKIGKGAFANSNLNNIYIQSKDIIIEPGVFYNTYITENQLSNYGISYTYTLFDNPNNYNSSYQSYHYTYLTYSYNSSYNPNYAPISYQENSTSYTNTEPGILDINYNIGDIYTMPLIYTERTGLQRQQRIGNATVEINEIDTSVPESDQWKLKIYVQEIELDNPLESVDIDYYNEIVGRYFYVQSTFITADINYFSTMPGWRTGIDGVDTFFAMKQTDNTYYPELENVYGVTNYALRKLYNNNINSQISLDIDNGDIDPYSHDELL